jgi:excisionase family DNA binding protein
MTNRRSGPPESEITKAVREELSLLQPTQVAELLGVTINWLYDRIEAGDIAVVRLGRRSLRLRPEDVKAFIEANWSQGNGREARLAARASERHAAPVRPRRGRPRKS